MEQNEQALREQLVRAGNRLLESGLVARTWGNLSARLSDTEFLITPSGLAYERLTPEDMAAVRFDTLESRGPHRPSSEKGMHAAIYRLRPEANFLIHTHQYAASCVGAAGRDLPDAGAPGGVIPCAQYGMPSTKKLAGAAAAAFAANPEVRAVFLRGHGAVCAGADEEDAFSAAMSLESACLRELAGSEPDGALTQDCGSSVREGERFRLKVGGEVVLYEVRDTELPFPADLHAAVYRGTSARCILADRSPAVAELSRRGRSLRPYLDDLAQIAGAELLCVKAEPQRAAAALFGRNAVLLRCLGALCTGKTREDAEAVRTILEKDCRAQLYAENVPGAGPLARTDAALQRAVYLNRYARLKEADR